MIKTILKNWKTSGVALLSAILGLLNLLYPNTFDEKLNTSILGILVILGGLAAKDGNVTGGTVANIPNDASEVAKTAKKDSK